MSDCAFKERKKSAIGKSATVELLSCKPYILGSTFVIKYDYSKTFCGQYAIHAQ